MTGWLQRSLWRMPGAMERQRFATNGTERWCCSDSGVAFAAMNCCGCWRTHERTALASASPEALCAHLPLLENQVSNVWSMGKDGRSYWPIKRQAATADRIANHKGRNPQERASLKKRLLRKWMSK